MKVAFIARSSLYKIRGGDTTQVVKTADELKKLGVQAEIFLASQQVPYEKFDLLHFFNIIRPADHLYHIRKSNKPYTVSTIYLDYAEFDRMGRGLLTRSLFKALGKSKSEYLKNVYRFVRKQDRLVSTEYLLGHKRAINKVLNGASLVLPNSESEFSRLSRDFGFMGNYVVVPNGIDKQIFSEIPEYIHRQEKIICVAQIYGRKNQHSLIQVCNKLGVPLDIIGEAPPNHKKYYEYCKKIAGRNVTFYDHMPQRELIGHYASAKVHALPGWFETTGLSSLEAVAMGCNAVVGEGGDTRAYFNNLAWFCKVYELKSIEKAVLMALKKPVNPHLREIILNRYTWQKAAEATCKAYEKILNNG
ncbi:MAG: glycosyltransferase family 4 protein [Bacteroidales bacterium]